MVWPVTAYGQTAVINISSPTAVVEGNSGTTTVTFNIICDPCDVVNAIVQGDMVKLEFDCVGIHLEDRRNSISQTSIGLELR